MANYFICFLKWLSSKFDMRQTLLYAGKFYFMYWVQKLPSLYIQCVSLSLSLFFFFVWFAKNIAIDRIYSSKIHMLKPKLQYTDIWRWDLWELIRFSWMGLVSLQKQPHKTSLSLPLQDTEYICEDTGKRPSMSQEADTHQTPNWTYRL